ncbi:MAG TPA: nitroreductase family protein [Bacteroidales bacterium]|nr:nitroreductase family protein [Bacteroidales bacterium]
MKTRFVILIVAVLAGFPVYGQSTGNAVTDALLAAYSPRNFSSVPVTDQQIDLILRCGIKAPSARNTQPWRFTVVREEATLKKLVNNIVPGNILIIISGAEGSGTGVSVDFDCALATENMFIAASGLGLGARIIAGPVKAAADMKDTLHIPVGFRPVMALRLGNVEKQADGVTGATTRKSIEEIVNYVK